MKDNGIDTRNVHEVAMAVNSARILKVLALILEVSRADEA